MKICIVGFGNIGSVLAGFLSLNQHDVRLFSSKDLGKDIPLSMKEMETSKEYVAHIPMVTDDLKKAVQDIDILLITYPSFLVKTFVKQLAPLLTKPTLIGYVPGSGGVEYMSKPLIKAGHTIVGLDRVPYIARVIEKNKSVAFSIKKSIQVATIPKNEKDKVAQLLAQLLNMDVFPLKNYLEVTLTPSNAILHTARVYSLFSDYKEDTIYKHAPLFYHDWDDEASKFLIGLDKELKAVVNTFSMFDLKELKTIREHYESQTVDEMTQKITGISAFKSIESPMLKVEDGYIPNFHSRYFTEDIPYGLLIIKSLALLTGVATPIADQILLRAQVWLEKDYLSDKKHLGKDSITSGIPQANGINTLNDLLAFYSW